MAIRVLVWGENVHEHRNPVVGGIYPDTMHGAIAAALAADPGLEVATATLQEPEHGLTEARLARTDVLMWWAHLAHGEVADAVAERVAEAVWSGMGAVFLHSAHFAKPFKRLMGSPCTLKWRVAGERERVWTVAQNHPIAAGLPERFELEYEEMYGEPFAVPEPMETVFISWFQGGEVFRSGLTWKRGAGKVFYFRPGHETYPTYHDAHVQRVLCNAAHWANNPARRLAEPTRARKVPVEEAPEPIRARGLDVAGGPG